MEHLFIPYELALKLKEKGFDEFCLAFYPNTVDNISFIKNKNTQDNYVEIGGYPQKGISAPLYQQVVDWFRDKHKISIMVVPNWEHHKKMDGWDCFVDSLKLDRDSPTFFNGISEDYYSGLDWSIREALKVI